MAQDEAKPGRDPRYSASTSRGFDADDADDGGGSDDMEPGEARGGVRYRPSELDGDEMNDASQGERACPALFNSAPGSA